MLFGNQSECENARKLIEEAVDNKEQKAKQRAKEYEKKKDEKRRDRQMYHLRHTNDYEELELPLGASKVCIQFLPCSTRRCTASSTLAVHQVYLLPALFSSLLREQTCCSHYSLD